MSIFPLEQYFLSSTTRLYLSQDSLNYQTEGVPFELAVTTFIQLKR